MLQSKILPLGVSFERALRFGYTGPIELRAYLDWLKTLDCDTCGSPPPSDPSHIDNYMKGMGRKSPDFFAIPQCRECHYGYESTGSLNQMLVQYRMHRAAIYLVRAIYEGKLVWRR